jgi:hypothetical protein
MATVSQLGNQQSLLRKRIRFVLGNIQMFGAVLSFVLIATTGITRLSLTVTILTCVTTSLSVMLFGRRDCAAASTLRSNVSP